ncbi:unnamed protein product [Caenorhabditis angaria]|uniref:Cytosolic fatty-acid binding proteins domain-containing protein n=1 Tax=Caenorhabditis angaria TaxID=860376 RepID=A0A9P1MS99_9PELO|nr:unnamed protein product [Caenorhabditis angaria]
MSAQDFVGRWKLVESEHFEEYMKEVGVGLITRKAAANLKPTLEIKNEGDVWHHNHYSTFKNTFLSFKLGEEFEETTGDGRTLKALIVFENGIFTHTQKKIKDSDKDSTFIHRLEDGKLIITLQSGNVLCRRVFVRE